MGLELTLRPPSRPTDRKEHSLYFRYWTDATTSVLISTGRKINPKHWELKEKGKKGGVGKLKNSYGKGRRTLEVNLENIKQAIELAAEQLEKEGKSPDPTAVKERYLKNSGVVKKKVLPVEPAGETLFGFWQKVVEGKVRTKKGKLLKPNSIKAKKQTMAILQRFQDDEKITLTFESMNMNFYNRFMLWQQTKGKERKNEKGKIIREPYDLNSQGKNVKDLKAILNLAKANELFENDKYSKWPVPKEKNEVVTLTKEEILRINALELSGTKADVRDLFVLACLLGPRISDYKSFKTESLTVKEGITFFEYIQEKTGILCKIPVHSIALNILDKRGGEFPKMISEQNFRAYIKDVCKLAELNDRVITKIRGSEPTYKKKWEAISPHSARRTFASGLFYGWFNRPMPASYCMRFTGHKSEGTFMLYINARAEEVNQRALEYFDLSPLKVTK